MKIDGKKVSANFMEKILVFGKQNMGKPEIINGNIILVRHSLQWRLMLLASVIFAVASQYIFAAPPWFVSIGLLSIPFCILAGFLYFGELYVKEKGQNSCKAK